MRKPDITMPHSSSFPMLTLVISLSAAGCSEPSVPPYDRAALLSEVSTEVIVPGYASVQMQASALDDAATAFCGAPDAASLATLRGAWRDAFLSWQRTLAYGFGPADEMNLGPEMSFAPTDPTAIEANIAGTDAIDAAYVDALGGGSKGLFALEYLLFADDESTTMTALADMRRCAYLAALTDHVARTSTRLADAWSPDGGDFASTLATAGQSGNVVYPAELSAISELLTALPALVDHVKVDKIGEPIGYMAAPLPDDVESPYANASVEAMAANLAGVRDVWMGTTHDFDDYLATRDPALAERVRGELDAADAAVAALPEPFAEYAAGADHAAGDAAYDALGDLEVTLATEVGATLAVSLGFNPSDGD